MARGCKVCIHPKRTDIEKISSVPGASYRKIADQYEISLSSLNRHMKSHVQEKIKKAIEAQAVKEGKSTHDHLAGLIGRFTTFMDASEQEKKYRDAISAGREVRETVISLGKLTGEVKDRHEITRKDGGPIKTETRITLEEGVRRIAHLLPDVRLN